jgi:hypothetical protein
VNKQKLKRHRPRVLSLQKTQSLKIHKLLLPQPQLNLKLWKTPLKILHKSRRIRVKKKLKKSWLIKLTWICYQKRFQPNSSLKILKDLKNTTRRPKSVLMRQTCASLTSATLLSHFPHHSFEIWCPEMTWLATKRKKFWIWSKRTSNKKPPTVSRRRVNSSLIVWDSTSCQTTCL